MCIFTKYTSVKLSLYYNFLLSNLDAYTGSFKYKIIVLRLCAKEALSDCNSNIFFIKGVLITPVCTD